MGSQGSNSRQEESTFASSTGLKRPKCYTNQVEKHEIVTDLVKFLDKGNSKWEKYYLILSLDDYTISRTGNSIVIRYRQGAWLITDLQERILSRHSSPESLMLRLNYNISGCNFCWDIFGSCNVFKYDFQHYYNNKRVTF